ncbi:MAG: primosomal protein N' [Myxococcales bacterium]|nr:primosomal protein N' [Myxococcales bacterium]
MLVEVAVPVPIRQSFTYVAPQALLTKIVPGMRVAVPFGRRKLTGFVLAQSTESEHTQVRYKAIADVLDQEPVFPAELLQFLRSAADYYMYPLGEVLRGAAPALSGDAHRRLREKGFLGESESLAGTTMPTRTTLILLPGSTPVTQQRLGVKQRRILELVSKAERITLATLRQTVLVSRKEVRGLESKGLLRIEEHEAFVDPFFGARVPAFPVPVLNSSQRSALDIMKDAVENGAVENFLLHGVTGSGKTEVYMGVIGKAQEQNKGAIVLVPEIALTPQLVARFRARFGDAIAVLHSGLGNRERYDTWRRLRRGELKLAIGARSALFAPVESLGIIVVDEEHDHSFKQEEGFRYHARDMALLRAHLAGAVCILGSATPSLESYSLAQSGRIRLLTLPKRATLQHLPQVELVDLAQHGPGPSGHPLITTALHRGIEACLNDQSQAILFLNRRGFSTLRCLNCNEMQRCPACSVALTSHRHAHRVRCHYCDFSRAFDERCGVCGAVGMTALGAGTQRIEEVLAEAFPGARVARLDRDTASKDGVEHVLDRMHAREIDILVGTQMVTKGHDLPEVTLVGVVLADQSLLFPDFRASERTFQLLAQVAGRAGRGGKPGRVIVQSYQTGHPAIVHACRHDYESFYASEVRSRKESGYPPFFRLAAVRIDSGDEETARRLAEVLASKARTYSAHHHLEVQVLGPAPAPIERLRGRYRYRLLLRAARRAPLRHTLGNLLEHISKGVGSARASIDIDPVSML